MDLSDELFRTTGRARREITATVVRPLIEADLALLNTEKGSSSNPIKRLSDRHHALARAIASGIKDGEAAIRCGYTASRVSILKSDPAFSELIEFYRADVDKEYLDQHGMLASISKTAMLNLQDRLEDEPEKLSVGQLIELTKLGADRTGAGPQSSSMNINVNVDMASRLEAARKRNAARKIVDHGELKGIASDG